MHLINSFLLHWGIFNSKPYQTWGTLMLHNFHKLGQFATFFKPTKLVVAHWTRLSDTAHARIFWKGFGWAFMGHIFPWDCKFALVAWWPQASTNTLLWFWLHFSPRVTWPWCLEVCLAVSVRSARFATMNHQSSWNNSTIKKAAVDHFILDGDCLCSTSTVTDARSKHNGGAISVSHLQSLGSRLLTCAASWHRWSNGHPWRCDQSSKAYRRI